MQYSPPSLAPDAAVRLPGLEDELRQVRAEAAAAQRQLAALTTHLREGLVLLDDEQRIVLLNDQVCAYFNLPWPARQWEGQPIATLIQSTRQQLADPAAYDDNIIHLRRRLAAGDVADTSYLQLLTGRVLERDIMQVRLGDGPGWLFTYRDVTDRYRAERQRDEQRHFYETVLDELPVEVVVLDQEFRYVYANPQAVPDPEQRAWLLSGHTVLEFCQRYGFPLELAEHRRRMFAKAQVSSEPVFWDDRTPQPGGDLVHQRQFKLLSGAGQPGQPYMLGSGLDVTARVRAEEQSQRSDAARREQQEFTEQVLDTLPNALFVRDETGQLTFSNFRMAELTTRLRDPAARAAPGHPWQPVGNDPVLTADQDAVTEDSLTLPSGETRWFHTVRRLLERPDGRRQVLGVSTDITDLKAAQLAAEQAAQARENFLANMSHEIRTPMNGVLGIASLLAKTDLTPEQQGYLRTIRSSGTHLLGLLNDVLDVAKIHSGKLELEQVPFELLDSVSQAVAPLAWQAEEKGLRFEFERLPRTAWVRSDSFRLNQVLLNLLSNAIKFTEHGSITLRTSLVAELPTLLLVRFEVQDTGIGIRPGALARVFESFTQAYADTSRRYGGTGLGLTISQALVGQLGGELTVESSYGQGSTFGFTLPLPLTEPLAPAPPPAESNHQLLRGTRILLAEDNETNRLVASLHLSHWGVQVDEAEDGLVAWNRLDTTTYDAVLMDIQMPGLSGVEVTRRLRQHPDPHRAATPVLALTANAFASDNEKYLAAGLNDYLAKPFDEETLYAKLVALLHPAAPPPHPYDLTHLRHEAKGQPEFVARMLQAFRNGAPPVLAELQAAATARQWPRVAELAHHLKPNVQQLAIAAAIGPVFILETPPFPSEDDARHQVAAAQFSEAVEAALLALALE